MCIKNRLKALQEKHAAADALILLLELNPRRDDAQIRTQKKIKLECKDEIVRLQNPDRATAPKPKKPLSKTKQKKLAQISSPVHQLPQPAECPLDMKKVA